MNFDFVNNISGFENVYKDCSNAENFVYANPDLSCISARKANEFFVKLIYETVVGNSTGFKTIDLMTDGQFISYFNGRKILLDCMHIIRKAGNKAAHVGNISDVEALDVLKCLHYVTGEILIDLGKISSYPNFIIPANNNSGPIQIQNTPNEPIVKEEVIFEAKQKLRNIHRDYINPDKIGELKAVYLKALLTDAGFNICKKENVSYPNSLTLNMLLPDGNKIEFTLNGKNGKPIAVIGFDSENLISAKSKALSDINKLQQLTLGYTPIAYYTDGFNIHIIDQLGFEARKVSGFHSIEDLEYLIQKQTLMTDLTNASINLSIAGRDYQQKAIKAVCKVFNGRRRKSLIVLATGTGKTRLSVALVDLLSKAGWTKNILFLADRKSLVRQANKAFKNFLPHTTTALYCGDSNEKDPTAKIVFSTYSSMINLINGEHNPFGIGHFDLIIIDEAHRSIFDKYQAIFDYFDSMMLGLTATPRGENNKSTYEVFELEKDHPDYYYELEDAVADGYLVPFALLDKTTVGLRRGYKYSDLSDDEKELYEKAEELRGEEPTKHANDDEIQLGANLVNKQTIDIMLHDLMKEGLKVENNEKIGKTIIFAKGHNEAAFIVERFHKLYNYLPEDFCALIDYASEDDSQVLIDKFYIKDKNPQIAVSVDMLDTGIDVPEILNLVFFKAMQSKIKFLQMIGRGTRTCNDLYGPGDDKKGFYIFDYYDNFNYFSQDEKPWSTIGYEVKTMKTRSVSNGIYRKQLTIAGAIQLLDLSATSFEIAYKDNIIKNMVDLTNNLNNEDISVKYNMDFVTKYRNADNWKNLSENDVSIDLHVLDLYPPIPGDPKVKIFDSLMYSIEIAHLEWELSGENEQALFDDLGKYIDKLNKYVRKLQRKNKESNLPALSAKISTISDLKDGNLLITNHSVEHIEDVRKDLRDIMVYLPDDKDFLVIDVNDEGIDKSEEDPANKSYDDKAEEWIKNNIKLKEFIKIRMLEALDQSEIDYLKQVFFTQLGTETEFMVWSNNKPLLVWLRYQVGIDDGAVQAKFGTFLNSVVLTPTQLDYCNKMIEYTKLNGDILMKVCGDASLFPDFINVFDTAQSRDYVKQLINGLHDAIKE